MKTTVRIEGLKELDDTLEALIEATSSRTAKAVIRKALIDAGEPMAERARQLVPARSGKLRASIGISAKLKNNAGAAAFAAARRGGADLAGAVQAKRTAQTAAKAGGSTVEVYVGPSGKPARMAHLVEFGTKPHKIRARSGAGMLAIWGGNPAAVVARTASVNHPGSRPQPYMRPAFEGTAQAVLGNIGEAMRRRLAEASARAARRKAKLTKG